MSFFRLVATIIVSLVLLLSSSPIHAIPPAACVFDTFEAPTGFTFSQINGVSDDGTVVGQLVNSDTQELVAFTRSAGGIITEYTVPKALTTWLYARNGVGVNVGFFQDTTYPQHVHGFLLQGETLTAVNYPKAANTWLFHANQLGDMVGSYSASVSVIKGFRLLNGKYTTIAFPGALSTYAMAINDNGKIVGTYSSSPVSNGFVWQNGSFSTLNFPGSSYGTVLTGVNNAGAIVGNHLTADNDYGFIYENGLFKNVVYPDAKFAMVGGINNNGVIAGQIYFTEQSYMGYTAVCR